MLTLVTRLVEHPPNTNINRSGPKCQIYVQICNKLWHTYGWVRTRLGRLRFSKIIIWLEFVVVKIELKIFDLQVKKNNTNHCSKRLNCWFVFRKWIYVLMTLEKPHISYHRKKSWDSSYFHPNVPYIIRV